LGVFGCFFRIQIKERSASQLRVERISIPFGYVFSRSSFPTTCHISGNTFWVKISSIEAPCGPANGISASFRSLTARLGLRSASFDPQGTQSGFAHLRRQDREVLPEPGAGLKTPAAYGSGKGARFRNIGMRGS